MSGIARRGIARIGCDESASHRDATTCPSSGASNGTPPTIVPTTRTSLSASGGTLDGSSASTAKSARLPTSMLPISGSSRSVYAAPSVIACSASADRNALARSEHATRRGAPVDRTPRGEQRRDRRDRRIRVHRERNAERMRGARSIHALGAIRPHRHAPMNVAPVVEVVAEQVDAEPERAHAPELRGIRHLAVLKRMSMIGARIARQRALEGVDRDLGRLVTVDMDVKLQPGVVIRRDQHRRAVSARCSRGRWDGRRNSRAT